MTNILLLYKRLIFYRWQFSLEIRRICHTTF